MAPFAADPAPDAPPPLAAPTAEPGLATGLAEVDEVLVSLQQLDELPVEEHVAVFEQAHDTLRHALDGTDSRAG